MDYKEIIESRYNRDAWQQLLHDIFLSRVNFWRSPKQVAVSSRLARVALNLGKISLADGESIAVYEVQLSDNVDIERNRRGIRDMLTTDWRSRGYAGAFMFCYRAGESVLRFSYVSESWSFADDGTYKKDSTDTRRFTYLLGEGHRSRTAIQQFESLKRSGLSLKDLTKAFSVDAVSDMFFDDYKKQYEDIIAFITGKRMVKVANKWEEKVVGEPNQEIFTQFSGFANPEKAIRDYVKKLMGRLVFLQFLQKKGWLGVTTSGRWGDGDREFIQHLFERTADKDHFIDNVLERLFDDINTARPGDVASEAVGKGLRVPYLNGGLFERDAADAVDFPLPSRYMQAMLDFFASYNFTIDENDPDDAEMGVDPEMLGRIFENLLEDNKDKGAFYTPKEIVAYMCRESLIAYLQTDVADDATKKAIRQFVTTHRVVDGLPDDTLQKLRDVKICDPAIGSGAFPMGLLKELYQCRAALEGFDQRKAAEIKKHIIQHSIYGVDIERGAVDTARLRFWLALIVDEDSPEALPNLDFKIMQGNSLLEQYKGADLSSMTEKKVSDDGSCSLFDDMIDVYREQLRNMLAKYYDCTDHAEKAALRQAIIANVKQQLAEDGVKVDFGNLDLAENDQFFLWHTWFHDVFSRPSKEGFDIVIGNPPYVSAPAQVASPILAEQRKRIADCGKYHTLNEKWDLYLPFIELGLHLLAKGGIFSMIVPYPLTNQKYAKKLRRLITEEYRIMEIADLNGTKIFDNANVSNCIPFIQNDNLGDALRISHIFEDKSIREVLRKSPMELRQDEKGYVWNLSHEQRTVSRFPSMYVLGDFCYISVGMVLNADEKEEKGAFRKDDLISDCYDDVHCREYIEAKDIDKYQVNRIRYLEWNTDRCPDKLRRPTFRELYDCQKIVMNCLGTINATIDCTEHLLHNHSIYCAVLWCDLHSVNNKSITSSVKKFCKYSRSEMELLSNKVNLFYMLGILNSKIASTLLADQRGGDYHIYPEHIRNIPIPIAPQEIQMAIAERAKAILHKKANGEDTAADEKWIDEKVSELYRNG